MRRGPLFPRRVQAGRLVFRDPLPACGLLYLLLYFDSSQFLRIGLLAACLHECGHILAFWTLFRRLPVIEVTVTGFCMQTRGCRMGAGQRFCLAAAGPAANALLALLAEVELDDTGMSDFPEGYVYHQDQIALLREAAANRQKLTDSIQTVDWLTGIADWGNEDEDDEGETFQYCYDRKKGISQYSMD